MSNASLITYPHPDATVGFWDRLGYGEDGLPVHLPVGVDADGNGPVNDETAYRFVCWCIAKDCHLTAALDLAWEAGARVADGRWAEPVPDHRDEERTALDNDASSEPHDL